MSTGLLILRVVVGLLFVGHGTQKLFGWFEGHGIEGTAKFLEQVGYRPGRRHAVMAGLGEAVGGALLVLGLFTPLAAAMLIGVMVNAMVSVHAPNGLWSTDNGIEYPLVLAAVASCLAFTGPGAASVDEIYRYDLAGFLWGVVATTFGVCAGLAVLWSRHTDEPVVEPEPEPARRDREAVGASSN